MKERPILFSAPMVRAVLDGRKTQTRRIVNPQPLVSEQGNLMGKWLRRPLDGLLLPKIQDIVIHCPYGQSGDRLWVREAHAIVPRTAYAHSEGVQQIIKPNDDHDATIYREGWDRSTGGIRWRPSIHMPRWASRILLEVTDVRVERLQDISEADAIAEGSIDARSRQRIAERRNTMSSPDVIGTDGKVHESAITAYRALWESINGAVSWEANPWVWVIEFRRIST